MINRRVMLIGAGVTVATGSSALAHKRNFEIDDKYLPQIVRYRGYDAGTIVVDPKARFLYHIQRWGLARRYGVGVGRAGLAWSGEAVIERKAKWPRWTPTANMIRREPEKYAQFADGVPGGPGNPLGSRALYLYRNGRDTYYRIHGTTEPWTLGRAVSNGCVRLVNEHVQDLYDRVPTGTPVVVLG